MKQDEIVCAHRGQVEEAEADEADRVGMAVAR
jgi:hypothetical protein